ncbi:MAG: hypothetical protein ACRENX_12900 [Candidatus Dormibacteria bacterium]
MAAFVAVAGLAGATAIATIPTVSAASPIGSIFIFSDTQTVAPGDTSGSVFIQAQDLQATPEPIYQSAPLLVGIAVSDQTTGVAVTVASSVTIPAGAFSTTFTFTASNSGTTEGSFLFTIGGNLTTYTGNTQSENVEPDLEPAGTTVTPGFNNAGTTGSVPLSPGASASYFSSPNVGTGITNSSGGTLYYEVIAVDGSFTAGGDGTISPDLPTGCTQNAGVTTTPGVITIGTSPYRPAGSYSLEFLVGAYSDSACTTPVGYYQGESGLVITNGAYHALSPTRLLDTRSNGGPLGANASRALDVVGTFGSDVVPANATAVALNVTVTEPSTVSYLTAYPAGAAVPVVSNLNFNGGETVPNSVIVQVGTGGVVDFYNAVGNTDFIVDLEGYFAPETASGTTGSYVAMTPDRICDTRPTSVTGQASDECTGSKLSAGGTLNVPVESQGSVPSTGVAAIVANVTVTDTTAASYLTAYPGSVAPPLVSNLNWSAGETVANRVIVPIGAIPSHTSGITLYNSIGTTDVIVDIDGYFTDGSTTPSGEGLFTPVTPARVLDTRTVGTTLTAGATISQQFQGVSQMYPYGGNATAVVINVTATDTSTVGYFTVYPNGAPPLASDLNWAAHQTVPNLDVADLASGGALTVYNAVGSADAILDVFGFFSPTG